MSKSSRRQSPGQTEVLVLRTLFSVLALGLLAGCNVASSGMNAEGTRFYQSGNTNAAIQRFHQAIQTYPRGADSYYNLGAIYHQLAKSQGNDAYYTQAETYYNQCLDLNPDHVECYRGLAVMLAEQDRSDASQRLLDGWAKQNPFSAEAQVELARLHKELGDNAAEEHHLLAALARDPSHARARAALGAHREKSGDLTQALENYNVSLSRNPLQPQLVNRSSSIRTAMAPPPVATGPTLVGGPLFGSPSLFAAPAPIRISPIVPQMVAAPRTPRY